MARDIDPFLRAQRRGQNPFLDAHTKRTLTRFENAVRDHAFKGAAHPEDHEEIEERYNRAKAALVKRIWDLSLQNTVGISLS